jgi:hypothetical protein
MDPGVRRDDIVYEVTFRLSRLAEQCCSGKKPARLMTKRKSGAKGFPTARPWMISH